MESNPPTAADYAYSAAENAQRDLAKYIKSRSYKTIAQELRSVCDAAEALDDAVNLLKDILRPVYDSEAMKTRILAFISEHERKP